MPNFTFRLGLMYMDADSCELVLQQLMFNQLYDVNESRKSRAKWNKIAVLSK